MSKIPPERRWMMGGFTSANLYLAGENVLIVRRNEVDVRDFPEAEVLSCVSAIHCAYDMKEVLDNPSSQRNTVPT
jgi:hypothetical protein